MKKILLVLLTLILVLALFGCNNDVDTDTQTDTQSDTQINGSDKNQESKENTVVVNKIYDRYFDKITPAPTYLLDDIEETKGSYKIIKTYEEYATCVDKTDGVNAELFNDNCILIIREYGTAFNGVKSESFLSENKIVREEPGVSYAFVGEQRLAYFYLIIPKSYVFEGANLFGTFDVELNLDPKNYYYSESQNLLDFDNDLESFEEKEAFIFSNESKFKNFLSQLGCSSLSYMINDNSITIVFRYDIKEKASTKVFKDFYIDGSVIHLTYDMFGASLSDTEENNLFFVRIPKEKLNGSTLPENPIFHITINQYYD